MPCACFQSSSVSFLGGEFKDGQTLTLVFLKGRNHVTFFGVASGRRESDQFEPFHKIAHNLLPCLTHNNHECKHRPTPSIPISVKIHSTKFLRREGLRCGLNMFLVSETLTLPPVGVSRSELVSFRFLVECQTWSNKASLLLRGEETGIPGNVLTAPEAEWSFVWER